MAITVESVSTQATFTAVTDVGSTGEFVATNPSGLAEGDMQVLIAGVPTGTVNTPSGWTKHTLPGATGIDDVVVFWKVATAGDVSAGNVTVSTSSDSTTYAFVFYRLTGTRTSGDPILSDDHDSLTNGSGTLSGTVALTPPSGTLFIMVNSADFTGLNNFPDFTSQAITGPTVSLTERMDAADSTLEEGMNIVDGISSTGSAVTGYSFETSNSDADTIHTNLLAIYPQQNASETLSLTSTSQTAFTPSVSAGANISLTVKETSQTAFSPTADAFDPTLWTTINKT